MSEAKVEVKHAVFCTNTAYNHQTKLGSSPGISRRPSGCLTDSDFVNANADPNAIKTLSLQRHLAETMKSLDQAVESVALPSIEDAINFMKEKDVQVFVTGSLHLVGGTIAVLEEQV